MSIANSFFAKEFLCPSVWGGAVRDYSAVKVFFRELIG